MNKSNKGKLNWTSWFVDHPWLTVALSLVFMFASGFGRNERYTSSLGRLFFVTDCAYVF